MLHLQPPTIFSCFDWGVEREGLWRLGKSETFLEFENWFPHSQIFNYKMTRFNED